MKKKLVSLLLATSMVVTLAACGETGADTVTSDSVVLGDATLTFDSTTGALVINF